MSAVAPRQLDFVRPFAYVFEDPEWLRKILIGGLFYLAGFFIVGWFFILGYAAQTTRNVIAGREHPLPEWDDLGNYFAEGLRIAGVWLVYMLPLFFLFGALIVPAVMMGALAGNENEAGQVIATGMTGCIYCLMFPLMLALMAWMPAVMLRVAVRQTFASAFEFRVIWRFIRGNVANYLLAIVVWMVARFIGGFGVMFFCIGVIFTGFWAFLITAHAFAQAWLLSATHEA
ncbi:MAG TPA: DUF4013 domain-containing protein [Thermoanaerobaculia bacterium]|jgi:hypothetical protein